jgi:NADH-quinone oxidoreductase subunit L
VLPAVGAAVLLLGGRRTNSWGPLFACATTGAAFVLGLVEFFALQGQQARSVDLHLFSWIPVAGFRVDAGLLFDPLSATFVLLITGVGLLIHIYSLGYMEHDPRKRVFFAYLNLFVAAMLLLVLGDSYLALYVGWRASGSRPTCSSPSGSTSRRRPPRPRRRSSPTGWVMSGCRWPSW